MVGQLLQWVIATFAPAGDLIFGIEVCWKIPRSFSSDCGMVCYTAWLDKVGLR